MQFAKYQGTGNDFILIDDRQLFFPVNSDFIAKLCNRHFGIGADGILLLRNLEGYDFEMIYFNSDGSAATFCGNGGRCIVAFAQSLEIIENDCRFKAADGEHSAKIIGHNNNETIVSLEMRDAIIYENNSNSCYLNTGTFHFVEFVNDPQVLDIVSLGRNIRYSERFAPHGTNVNFVKQVDDTLFVRTYEKGVENETLSCGTGVTASAVAASLRDGGSNYTIHTAGGVLKVRLVNTNNIFSDIFLQGPAICVFEGYLTS